MVPRRSDWVEAPSPLYTSLMPCRGTPYSKPARVTAGGCAGAERAASVTGVAGAGAAASQVAMRVRTRSARRIRDHLQPVRSCGYRSARMA
jgi:hypothetical protein